MPANVYECLLMLDTGKIGGDLPAVVQGIHGMYERHQAEVLASRTWDHEPRKLSYPVRKQKRAQYYLTYFKTSGENLRPIEYDLSLNEAVLRSLVIKIEPKLVDNMLLVAKDPHALALQAAHEEPGEGDYGDMGGGYGDHRRRRNGDRD